MSGLAKQDLVIEHPSINLKWWAARNESLRSSRWHRHWPGRGGHVGPARREPWWWPGRLFRPAAGCRTARSPGHFACCPDSPDQLERNQTLLGRRQPQSPALARPTCSWIRHRGSRRGLRRKLRFDFRPAMELRDLLAGPGCDAGSARRPKDRRERRNRPDEGSAWGSEEALRRLLA
jgi:hypothetical protein